MSQNVAAIICAAGASSRFGGNRKKAFVDVAGRAVFFRSAELFSNRDDVKQVLLGITSEDEEFVSVKWGPNLKFFDVSIFIGGDERFDTVKKGIELIKDEIDLIAVHDACRCCVTEEIVNSTIAAGNQRHFISIQSFFNSHFTSFNFSSHSTFINLFILNERTDEFNIFIITNYDITLFYHFMTSYRHLF